MTLSLADTAHNTDVFPHHSARVRTSSFMRPTLPLLLAAAWAVDSMKHNSATKVAVDLSKDFAHAPSYNDNDGAARLRDLVKFPSTVRSYMVLERGRIVADYYGRGVTNATKFQLASATKGITGVLIATMVKRDIISLSDNLGDIFPRSVWQQVDGSAEKQNITIEALLSMTSGLTLDRSIIQNRIFYGATESGGDDLVDSLNDPLYRPELRGTFHYLTSSNILSYIILSTTGMTPEQYAQQEVFPLLGITQEDYEWTSNKDGVSYALHGLWLTLPGMAKIGQLFSQMYSDEHAELFDVRGWLADEVFNYVPIGTEESPKGEEVIFGYGHLLWKQHYKSSDVTAYCAYGFVGTAFCFFDKVDGVLAMSGANFMGFLLGSYDYYNFIDVIVEYDFEGDPAS